GPRTDGTAARHAEPPAAGPGAEMVRGGATPGRGREGKTRFSRGRHRSRGDAFGSERYRQGRGSLATGARRPAGASGTVDRVDRTGRAAGKIRRRLGPAGRRGRKAG